MARNALVLAKTVSRWHLLGTARGIKPGDIEKVSQSSVVYTSIHITHTGTTTYVLPVVEVGVLHIIGHVDGADHTPH